MVCLQSIANQLISTLTANYYSDYTNYYYYYCILYQVAKMQARKTKINKNSNGHNNNNISVCDECKCITKGCSNQKLPRVRSIFEIYEIKFDIEVKNLCWACFVSVLQTKLGHDKKVAIQLIEKSHFEEMKDPSMLFCDEIEGNLNGLKNNCDEITSNDINCQNIGASNSEIAMYEIPKQSNVNTNNRNTQNVGTSNSVLSSNVNKENIVSNYQQM